MNFCSGTKKQSKNYKNRKQNKTKLKLGWAFYLLIFIAVRVAVTLSWYDIAATWVLKSKDKVKFTDRSSKFIRNNCALCYSGWAEHCSHIDWYLAFPPQIVASDIFAVPQHLQSRGSSQSKWNLVSSCFYQKLRPEVHCIINNQPFLSPPSLCKAQAT